MVGSPDVVVETGDGGEMVDHGVRHESRVQRVSTERANVG